MTDAHDHRAESHRFAFVHRHRLSILLAALVLLLLLTPFLNVYAPDRALGTLVTILYVAMLLAHSKRAKEPIQA